MGSLRLQVDLVEILALEVVKQFWFLIRDVVWVTGIWKVALFSQGGG